MILMITGFILVGSLLTVLIASIHGYPAAVTLGVDAIMADLILQWLRFRLMRQRQETGRILMGILGGLAARVVSVFLFIRLALWWLESHSHSFYLFAILLLSIPLWSILMGFRFKKELG